MDGEKNLRNPNSHQKSNDKQERRPEGNPNQQKIAETGGAVEVCKQSNIYVRKENLLNK